MKNAKSKDQPKEKLMPIFTGNLIRDTAVSNTEKIAEASLAIFSIVTKDK